jgi:hypothetical protein
MKKFKKLLMVPAVAFIFMMSPILVACFGGPSWESDDPAIFDNWAINSTRSAIEQRTFNPIAHTSFSTETLVHEEAIRLIQNDANHFGVLFVVNKVSYNAPVAGCIDYKDGTNGSYVFTVTISRGLGTTVTTAQRTLTITATVFSGVDTRVQDNLAIAQAKDLVDGHNFPSLAQTAFDTEEKVLTEIERRVGLLLHLTVDVETTVNKISYAAAVLGNLQNFNGTEGSYVFTVTINRGMGTAATSIQKTVVLTTTALLQNGTYQHPFLISNAAELIAFAEEINSRTTNFTFGSYALNADINLLGMEWTPIGNGNTDFSGTFDGRGFKISNFKISQPAPNGAIGLFGRSSALIENLGIENATINIPANNPHVRTATPWVINAGIFVGTGRPTIENCWTTSNITVYVTNSTGATSVPVVNVGGLVGRMIEEGTIIDSFSTGNVEGGVVNIFSSGSMMASEGSVVGGLAGYADGRILISGSHSTGTVRAVGYNPTAGGLVGLTTSLGNNTSRVGLIEQSFATGDVSVVINEGTGANQAFARGYAGGLVGENAGTRFTISDCFARNSVNVSGQLAAINGHAGGITGLNFGTVTNSMFIGDVRVAITSTGTTNFVELVATAGGIVGIGDGIISNCLAIGTVRADGTLGAGTRYVHVHAGNVSGAYVFDRSPPTWDFQLREQGTVTNCFHLITTLAATPTTQPSGLGAGNGWSRHISTRGQLVTQTSAFGFTDPEGRYVLNSPVFYMDVLGWCDEVWNFGGLDAQNIVTTDRVYPTLRNGAGTVAPGELPEEFIGTWALTGATWNVGMGFQNNPTSPVGSVVLGLATTGVPIVSVTLPNSFPSKSQYIGWEVAEDGAVLRLWYRAFSVVDYDEFTIISINETTMVLGYTHGVPYRYTFTKLP